MSPEVAKLTYRAVIDYLGGQTEEFERLINIAMRINENEMTCSNCGGVQIPCRIKNVRKDIQGHCCVQCGQVVTKDRVIRKGKQMRRGNIC